MRLGSPLPSLGLARRLDRDAAAAGFRAAYWPLGDDADAAAVDAYAAAARAADVVIAEVGCWSNPISPDDADAPGRAGLCKARLELADRVGARCCVNLAGSRGETWDGPHPDNLARATFALVVDTVREIIDAVRPRSTYYTLEPMPWSFPDSADSYLELMRAIDRPRFAVHLDPVNFINKPAKFFRNAELLRECFAKLGPHIGASTPRTSRSRTSSPCTSPRSGRDWALSTTACSWASSRRLDPDTPILVEHLSSAAEYDAAVAHVRSVAGELGLET